MHRVDEELSATVTLAADLHSASTDGESPPDECVTHPLSSSSAPLRKVNEILAIARSGAPRNATTTAALPDEVQLPEDREQDMFTLDTAPSPELSHDDMVCPDTLEDMEVIVRTLREARLQQLHASHIAPAAARRVPKTRHNNLTVTNVAQLLHRDQVSRDLETEMDLAVSAGDEGT
jgi:hypothetical protein